MISLTYDSAVQFAPYVRVNCIAPGWVNTEMNKELLEDFVKEETERILVKRFAEPKEIAKVVCEKMKFEKLFISGGATINNAFMEKGIVDNIILNYNPYVLNKGIPIFEGNYFENKLKLEKIIKEKEDIVQVHYSIIK